MREITVCVRYSFFIFNLIFATLGIFLLVLGTLNIVNLGKNVPHSFEVVSIILILVGIIVFVISCFGCFGAMWESRFILKTYVIILMIIIVAQVALGVYVFIKINAEDDLKVGTDRTYQKFFDECETDPENNCVIVNAIQKYIECCGFQDTKQMQFKNHTYLQSCCKKEVQSCSSTNNKDFFNRSCSQPLFDRFRKSLKIFGYMTIGTAAIELSGGVAGLCLSESLKRHSNENSVNWCLFWFLIF